MAISQPAQEMAGILLVHWLGDLIKGFYWFEDDLTAGVCGCQSV